MKVLKNIPKLAILLIVIHTLLIAEKWQQCNGPYYGYVAKLYTDGKNLYSDMKNHGAIFYTEDNGENWKSDFIDEIRAVDSSTYVKAKATIVSVSRDGGQNFIRDTLEITENVNSIAFTKNEIFICTHQRVYHYVDSINKFVNLYQKITSDYLRGVISCGDSVFIYRDSMLEKFNLYSLTAENITIPDSGYIQSIFSIDNELFISRNYHLYRSKDYGDTWVEQKGICENCIVHKIVQYNGYLYAATSFGIYRSEGNWENWVPVNEGVYGYDIHCLQTHGGYLFAGSSIGVYRILPGDTSWELVNNGMPRVQITSVVHIGDTLFGCTPSAFYTSTDSGFSWLNMDFKNVVQDLKNIEYEYPSSVYAFGTDLYLISYGVRRNRLTFQNLYKSSDAGKSWQYIWTFSGNNISLIMSNDTLYTGEYNFIFFPPGKEHALSVENRPRNILSLASLGQMLFAIDKDSGLYRGNGNNWKKVKIDTTLKFNFIIGMDDILLSGTTGKGIFCSKDSGNTWTEMNNGIAFISDLSFTLCSRYGSVLFVGDKNGTIYYSSDKGMKWNKIPGFVYANQYNSMINLSPANGYLFSSSYEEGTNRYPLYEITSTANTINDQKNKHALKLSSRSANTLKLEYHLPDNENGLLSIYQINGKLIYKKSVKGKGNIFLKTSVLTPGIFIFRLVSQREAYSVRLQIFL